MFLLNILNAEQPEVWKDREASWVAPTAPKSHRLISVIL